MGHHPWLPVGFELPDATRAGVVLHGGADWQIVQAGLGRALLATPELGERWRSARLIERAGWTTVTFGSKTLCFLGSSARQVLAPVKSPALQERGDPDAFAESLRATRALDPSTALHDALFAQCISRLLPTYSHTAPLGDDVIMGRWLTGGVPVSVHASRRVHALLGWTDPSRLEALVRTAGLTGADPESSRDQPFRLAGRTALERFFREHVLDIVENTERYRALGIAFPGAIILHGPPGCGKTYAAERMVEYLGWPCFNIDASSIASPFIHETSRKVAQVFDDAIKSAPSVIVIDEMESFLSDRDQGHGSHHVEEIGEFLRRLPEAAKNRVLVIAMTNRFDLIDGAVQRRGRFDHVIRVDMPTAADVHDVLQGLLSTLPTVGLELRSLADRLSGRPLSDIAFIVREAGRLTARAGKAAVDQASLLQAIESTPARGVAAARKVGFT